jgi:hypothetical protein
MKQKPQVGDIVRVLALEETDASPREMHIKPNHYETFELANKLATIKSVSLDTDPVFYHTDIVNGLNFDGVFFTADFLEVMFTK